MTFLRSSMTLFAESGECHFSEELEEDMLCVPTSCIYVSPRTFQNDTQELRELRWKPTVDCR